MFYLINVLAWLAIPSFAGFATAETLNFDTLPQHSLPSGWKIEGTHQQGPLATWEVVKEPGSAFNQVLGLTKTNHVSEGTFNLVWTLAVKFSEGTIEVRMKSLSGKEDQGGGLIWRVQDKDNYYVMRYNPLESNFRVYFVKDGNRRVLGSEKATLKEGDWHTVKISHLGRTIKGYLDGQLLLTVEDETLKGDGGIGLWTKADAVSLFDDVTIEPK